MLPRSLAALKQHGFHSLKPNPTTTFRPNAFLRSTSTATHTSTSRISRLEARLPIFLRRYTTPLRSAPVSHITAFLLLHEITAVVPLFGLAGAFHYFDWLPPWIAEGAMVKSGVEKFGRYMRKKGWIDDGAVPGEDANEGRIGNARSAGSKWWGRGEGGVRIVVELATAYAVTKLLLPVRLVFSVWATPAFARWTVLPVAGLVKRILAPGAAKIVNTGGVVGTAVSVSPAAGTNAVGGGAIPSFAGKVK